MALERSDKIKMGLLVVLWFAVFFPIVPEMVQDWSSHSDNNHGFLVPLIALYFAWQKREELDTLEVRTSAAGGMMFTAALALYLLGYAGGTVFFTRVAMVLSLYGMLWYCLGGDWMRALIFPVLFLLFMVPVPYSLLSLVSMPLQLLATKVSAGIIEHCAIPVYREGNMLYFVGTQLEVAEACSGVRSILSLTMLASIFAYLLKGRWYWRTLLLLSAVPIAMTANIIRITGTGILAHYFGDQVARGFLHEFSGLAVFAFGVVTLGGLYTLIKRVPV
ncbi:exosortase A [Geomonas edaphica]|uniref:exosortase A n=1 Tax=Geomonas edaphica TaxID=2570226 RepID=UPI0010A7EF3A|nr:exosortase A [Geomonas edaphica]